MWSVRGGRMAGGGVTRRVPVALACMVLIVSFGCDGPVVPASPPRTMAAYSASLFAIDVEFRRPLDRTSATQAFRYSVTDPAGGRTVATRADWVDTLFGETVRLFFPLGALQDSTLYRLTVNGVLDVWGQAQFATDSATVEVFTGLWYSSPMRDLLNRKCSPCHNDQRAGGAYRTDSYAELFGDGSDGQSSSPRPNLVPGDARSLIVIRTSPRHSMFNVAHLSYAESQLFINWVVTYQARK